MNSRFNMSDNIDFVMSLKSLSEKVAVMLAAGKVISTVLKGGYFRHRRQLLSRK